MNLPTDLLRSFVTVAELGGITPACELLGRSQPAVSLQIKRLEELVTMSLFRRDKRKLELTEAGERYADLMTLMVNCILCGANPYDYFRDILDRIASGWPARRRDR